MNADKLRLYIILTMPVLLVMGLVQPQLALAALVTMLVLALIGTLV